MWAGLRRPVTFLVSLILAAWSLIAPVQVTDGGPEGILGVACRPAFAEVTPNAQHLCPEDYTGILLYEPSLASVPLLLATLHHEQRHLDYGADGPLSDPWNEREANRAGCEASWVPYCEAWLGHAAED